MVHWDVVSIVVPAGARASSLAPAVQRLALCAAPLALNEFGVTPLTPCSNTDTWHSPRTSRCHPGPYHGGNSADSSPPHWHRLHASQHDRRTRVYTVPAVPDLWSEPGLWQADQHSHPHLRPADVVVYVLEEGGQAKQTVLRHLAVQATETLHAVAIVGGVCDADLGLLQPAILATLGDAWSLSVSTCFGVNLEAHAPLHVSPASGMLIFRRSEVFPVAATLAFESFDGAPVHVTADPVALFVRPKDAPELAYAVPPACAYRVSTSPLTQVSLVSSGGGGYHVVGQPWEALPSQGLPPATPLPPHITLDSWTTTNYGGLFCGTTVLTTLVHVERYMLFYTIALPVAEALNYAGVPSLFLFKQEPSKGQPPPMLGVYLHSSFPGTRFRRYVPFQLEYYASLFLAPATKTFMEGGVTSWDYVEAHVPHWRASNISSVHFMPICYHPCLEYQLLGSQQSPRKSRADVLFPGVVSGSLVTRKGGHKTLSGTRREGIVNALTGAGVSVFTRSSQSFIVSGGAPKFGVEDVLDAKAGADVVLNMHSEGESGDSTLEVARLILHVSNGNLVVSERGYPDQDEDFEDLVVFIPRNKSKISAEDLTPLLGPANADKRGALARKAQASARTNLRCEALPHFRAALRALVAAAYPAWYAQSFLFLPQNPDQLRPCNPT